MTAEFTGIVGRQAGLRIVADDLTGALDSAAPFASSADPVHVGFSWRDAPLAPRLSVSTDSRDFAPLESAGAVVAVMHLFGLSVSQDTLWFKKVDSVLRGNPVVETLAAFRSRPFSHLVFAPAYPDLGRITMKARQYVVGTDGETGEATGPDLIAAFEAAGEPAMIWNPTADDFGSKAGEGVPSILVLDAATQKDLAEQAAELAARLPPTTLWAGAGGLALALAGARPAIAYPAVASIIVGTRHPVTAGQIEHLSSAEKKEVSERPEVFCPAFSTASPADTASAVAQKCLSMSSRRLLGRSVMVIGGDTLATVLRTVGAQHLLCIGEAAPGVAVSRIHGGRWTGVTLLSKSGGFGRRELLASL